MSILTAGMSFLTLVDKFSVLCAELGTARLEAGDPQKFCKVLAKLNEERNAVIHSAWGLPTPHGEVCRFKRTARRQKGFELKVTETDVDQTWALVSRLSKAGRKLWEFVP